MFKIRIRLLKTGFNKASMNMGIDESVLFHQNKGLVPPTLRFYGWKPAAVSIGYFQSMEEEIDLDVCKQENVDYVRRITGGGAVFHEKEVTYSFIIKEDSIISKHILESYKQICQGIIEGLKLLDIDAQFVPLNDIIAGGKKISGNAQTRRMGCILQHGTIIHDVDVEKMFSILMVPNEKIRDKMIATVKERVTSVNHLIGNTSFDAIVECLEHGFAKALGIDLVSGELTSGELEYAKKLSEDKYANREWNFKR